MINDIRFQASKLLEYNNVNTKDDKAREALGNIFEDIINDQNQGVKPDNTANSYMPLGIPAGFNIDFSLLEEMENNSNL